MDDSNVLTLIMDCSKELQNLSVWTDEPVTKELSEIAARLAAAIQNDPNCGKGSASMARIICAACDASEPPPAGDVLFCIWALMDAVYGELAAHRYARTTESGSSDAH